MRSKVVERIIDRTPKEVDEKVRLYADIILRINQLADEKKISPDIFQKADTWMQEHFDFSSESVVSLESIIGEKIRDTQ